VSEKVLAQEAPIWEISAVIAVMSIGVLVALILDSIGVREIGNSLTVSQTASLSPAPRSCGFRRLSF
jgi:hypothetical protein